MGVFFGLFIFLDTFALRTRVCGLFRLAMAQVNALKEHST